MQGYAGSERSSQSKAADEEAAARTSLAASYGGSTSSEGGNNDLTSHHLEVPQSNEHQLEMESYTSFPQLGLLSSHITHASYSHACGVYSTA